MWYKENKLINMHINENTIVISLYIFPICLLYFYNISYIIWAYPLIVYFLCIGSNNIRINARKAFILQVTYTIINIVFITSIRKIVGNLIYYPYPQYVLNLLASIVGPLIFTVTSVFIVLSLIFIIDNYSFK
ncbi:MAG: hypothetical protein E7I48_13130 [Clostridium celatum]|nr:hypothetical protein [Clostridium celatum]